MASIRITATFLDTFHALCVTFFKLYLVGTSDGLLWPKVARCH